MSGLSGLLLLALLHRFEDSPWSLPITLCGKPENIEQRVTVRGNTGQTMAGKEIITLEETQELKLLASPPPVKGRRAGNRQTERIRESTGTDVESKWGVL